MASRARSALTALVAIAAALAGFDSAAHVCGARQWQYDVASLQEARRRLKSNAIKSPHSRVDCAQTILGDPGLAGPFMDCEACARDYIGLLADSAVFMRQAADSAGSESGRKRYIEQEVETRTRLHEFVIASAPESLRANYLNANLKALADAMERLRVARQYHELMSVLNESSRLDRQVYKVWTRAIRSCAVWDFDSGDNLAGDNLRESLCQPNCIDELRVVYEGLRGADLVTADGALKTGLYSFPTPEECPQQE